MRILLINNQHFPKGGAHVVYFNTAELLKKNGHEVFFFSTYDTLNLIYKYSSYFPRAKNYRGLSFFSKLFSVITFFYNREAYFKIKKFIHLINPDIAHVHLFMGGLTVSILKALKENDIPIVHTAHDYRLICPAYTFIDKNNQICEKCRDGFFIRCAYNKCSLENKYIPSIILSFDAYARKYSNNPIHFIDKFIFVSHFSKNIHISFNSVFKEKSTSLYNFSPTKSIISKTPKGNYLFYFGRLSREKGIEMLVEVVKELNVELKIAGTGPLFSKLLKSTEKNSNIKILGFKSGDELNQLIQNCSYVCVPSEWYENNPLTIIESFNLGKPVVGANIGGIPELIQDNRGFLFNTKDYEALKKTLTIAINLSEEKYSEYSQNALMFAYKNLSENHHYENLIKIYKSILK